MREMFRTMFSSITSFFRAFELSACTLENYAKWAEGESAFFEQEGRLQRLGRVKKLKEKLELQGQENSALPSL